MKMKTAKVGRAMGKVKGLLVVLFAVAVVAIPQLRAEDGKTIRVSVGEAVSFPAENVSKLAIADPAIADVTPLSDKELSIIGKKGGVTTLTIVREGSPSQVYRVEVGNDAAAATIREMIGQQGVAVRTVGDTLVLDGQVDDELQASRAVQVATAYKEKVLNLLEIKKPRQIRIRTRVVEVNSDAVKKIGIKWFGQSGQIRYGLNYGGIPINGSTPDTLEHGLVGFAAAGSEGSIGGAIGADATLQLLETKGYARVLSEPTIVTMSGKEASFLAGQEVPIVQQLQNSFSVEFKEVGVRMKIKPTADSQNRINTAIHAEVSQLTDRVVSGGNSGSQLPVISSKKADTTLQLNDGQTIVIGGLLDNNISSDSLRKVPWLADIPIFGFLFRHKEREQTQTEILFFMTPEIVKDIDAETATAARTPLMRDWNNKTANENVLPVPKKGYDWGLHDPDGLGFSGLGSEPKPAAPKAEKQTQAPAPSKSEETSAPATAPAAEKPAVAPSAAVEESAPAVAAPEQKPAPASSAETPAPAAKAPATKPAPKEPTTNFGPARPAVQ
jgi:pilus assembly protein CpaC